MPRIREKNLANTLMRQFYHILIFSRVRNFQCPVYSRACTKSRCMFQRNRNIYFCTLYTEKVILL